MATGAEKAKWISLAALGTGLCALAAALIVRMNAKVAIASAQATAAESAEASAALAEKKARAEAATAASQESAKASEAKIVQEKRLLEQAEATKAKEAAAKAAADKERAVAEREKSIQDRALAEAEARAASENRAAALAAKETARIERDKAKLIALAEESKAKSAADALAKEKQRSEKIIAEAKLLELRRLNLAEMERELAEIKRSLDEREAALKPEKTIKDLADYSRGDNTAPATDAAVALPENDMSLPPQTRELFRASRLLDEERNAVSELMRSNTVRRLEKLFKQALEDDRIVDADFIYREIKLMYPDWKYTP